MLSYTPILLLHFLSVELKEQGFRYPDDFEKEGTPLNDQLFFSAHILNPTSPAGFKILVFMLALQSRCLTPLSAFIFVQDRGPVPHNSCYGYEAINTETMKCKRCSCAPVW